METEVCGPELLRTFSKFWTAPETGKEKNRVVGGLGAKVLAWAGGRPFFAGRDQSRSLAKEVCMEKGTPQDLQKLTILLELKYGRVA